MLTSFPARRYFNSVQSAAFPAVFLSEVSVVVSAPTGSGKTGVMELAILRLMQRYDAYMHAYMQTAVFRLSLLQCSLLHISACNDTAFSVSASAATSIQARPPTIAIAMPLCSLTSLIPVVDSYRHIDASGNFNLQAGAVKAIYLAPMRALVQVLTALGTLLRCNYCCSFNCFVTHLGFIVRQGP